MTALTGIIEKIDALSIRERGAILTGMLFVLYTVWNSYLMQPLDIEQGRIRAEMQQKQSTQTAINIQLQKLIGNSRKDPDAENKEKLALLKARLQEIESTMDASAANLVSPKNMARILETVLYRTKGLTLREVKGLGKSSLVEEEKTPKDGKEIRKETSKSESNELENAYKHGLRIEFEGDYMTTLDYIRGLESLEWRFLWDSLEFQVEEYPRSRVSITVFTLSLDQDWIGV